VHTAIPGSTFVGLPTGHVVFASKPADWLDAVLPFVEAVNVNAGR
jgi:hypothetical protein